MNNYEFISITNQDLVFCIAFSDGSFHSQVITYDTLVSLM